MSGISSLGLIYAHSLAGAARSLFYRRYPTTNTAGDGAVRSQEFVASGVFHYAAEPSGRVGFEDTAQYLLAVKCDKGGGIPHYMVYKIFWSARRYTRLGKGRKIVKTQGPMPIAEMLCLLSRFDGLASEKAKKGRLKGPDGNVQEPCFWSSKDNERLLFVRAMSPDGNIDLAETVSTCRDTAQRHGISPQSMAADPAGILVPHF